MDTNKAEQLACDLVHKLIEKDVTVATAESLTGGGVCASMAAVPGASATLAGGVCAYSAAIKRDVVGVDAALIEHRGTVDPEVAVALATRARELFNTDLGIGTTGVAGPDPLEGHPVGTVYIAVATAGGHRCRALHLRGDRNQIRTETVAAVCQLAGDYIN